MVLELDILTTRAMQLPLQVDAVGYGRHQGERIPCGPVDIVVLGDGGVGVAAGVGSIVPGAIVVSCPVHELQVGVGAGIVDVEDVGEAHLPHAQIDASLGDLCRERKGRPRLINELVGEANGLVYLNTRDIWRGAQVGVADDIEIREAGEP
jgi:hypothetical protein